MTPLAQARLVVAIAAVALLGVGLWYLRHSGYEAGKNEVQVQWDTDRIKRGEAQKDALVAYANRISQAEVQHDNDQALINRLHDAAGGVRIHLPACPSVTAASDADQDRAAGVFQPGVDQRFAEFQERVGGLIRRCDQLNIDAIRANTGR